MNSTTDIIFEILNLLMSAKYKVPDNASEIHMKRTAQQILDDGFFASCSDYGTVFCTIARQKGIKTKFMHYLDLIQFKIDPDHLSLHVFCECEINGYKLFIDPQRGMVQNIVDGTDYRFFLKRNGNDYILGYEELELGEKGINSEKKLLALMTEIGNKALSKN